MTLYLRYWIADENNGAFEGPYNSIKEAEIRLLHWVAEGIEIEIKLQEETGLTDEEIREMVSESYFIVQDDRFC